MLAVRSSALRRCAFFAAMFQSGATFATPWVVSVDQENGLPSISRGGGAALSSSYAFWAKDWAWTSQPIDFKVIAPFEYASTGRNKTLNFDLKSHVKKSSTRQLVWSFDLNAHASSPEAIGGGLVFKFDLASFQHDMGEPELLPGNSGWAWGQAGGTRVEVRFEPPMAAVFFERGRRSEVRAFFYRGGVIGGARRHRATLSVTGDMLIAPTLAERLGLDDSATWPTGIVDWNASPVDLSFLNANERPAGKHGFLSTRAGKLIFEDGAQVRFWGTNLTAYALFGTSRENVKQQARRLSELGFNLVRLHHHDSIWVNPNVFGDKRLPDTQNLSPAMLEKLDWWIKCLKDEGIYVWLDLYVGRQLKAGDAIDGFAEISKGGSVAELKGYNYVNASIRQAMKRFNEMYVNHRNEYTGLQYKDDPAIVAMLLANENDITNHFGNALLPDKSVPWHNALYMELAEAFASKHGLPKATVWRSWEHGPAKLFLNDLERRVHADMIGHLRGQGVKVPIVPTSTWGGNPLSSLPALLAGSLIDVHSYGGVAELGKSPIYAANMVHWIAAAHVSGRPLSVTEWNVSPFPAPDRHAVPLYLAATASHQGWDALLQYAYAQVRLNGADGPSNWHAFNDPGLLATLPAAALLYRRGDVREASTVYAFTPTADQLFGTLISPENSIALRTAVERGKLVIVMPQTKELPWLDGATMPVGAKSFSDPMHGLIASNAIEAVSDSGELRRNWEQGTYFIDVPRTQAAMGWIGGKKISLADVDINTDTRNATVVVQSLDENPISKAREIMISLGARSVPKSADRLPFQSEPVVGQLTIRAPKGLKLYRATRRVPTGSSSSYARVKSSKEGDEIPASYLDGRYHIRVDRALLTYWLFLR